MPGLDVPKKACSVSATSNSVPVLSEETTLLLALKSKLSSSQTGNSERLSDEESSDLV